MLSQIAISNYKSFCDLKLKLESLNILIGANAAGKSNFIGLFKFLKHLAKDGLENAIYKQGGPSYLRNIYQPLSSPISVKLTFNRPIRLYDPVSGLQLISHELCYTLQICLVNHGDDYHVATEQLKFKKLYISNQEKEKSIPGEILLSFKNGKFKVKEVLSEECSFNAESIILFSPEIIDKHQAPFMENPSLISMYPSLSQIFKEIGTYDFDPKLPKMAIPFTGSKELEENGHNLALILRVLNKNPEKQKEFLEYLQVLLPFISRLETAKLSDQQLYLQSYEFISPNQPIPGSFLSDGTINITAILLVLYFEQKKLVVLEEPERNIHPYLMSQLIHLIKDASEQKQIFITTHHPEIVKYASLEELLLVTRDSDGFSVITKPSKNKEVQTFLKNEIGIEELYIQNLLSLDSD